MKTKNEITYPSETSQPSRAEVAITQFLRAVAAAVIALATIKINSSDERLIEGRKRRVTQASVSFKCDSKADADKLRGQLAGVRGGTAVAGQEVRVTLTVDPAHTDATAVFKAEAHETPAPGSIA